MSLIQQALKRKMDEQQGRASPPPPPLPQAPRPVMSRPPPSLNPPPVPDLDLSPMQDEPHAPPAPPPSQKLALAAHAAELPADHAGFTAPQMSALPPLGAEHSNVVQIPSGLPRLAEKKNRKIPWLNLLAIFLVMLVIGGGTLWLLMKARQRSSAAAGSGGNAPLPASALAPAPVKAPAGTAGQPATPPDVPAPKSQGGAAALLPLPDIPAIHGRVEKMKTEVLEFRKESAAAEQGVITPAQPAASAPVVAPPPPVAQPAVVPPAAQPTVTAPVSAPVVQSAPAPVPVLNVTWPEVRISGVMAHSSKGKSAIINDSLINVGESVDGMTLVEVRETGVTLEYKNDKRFFAVGRRH